MNGAHDTGLDRSIVIQRLCHRSEAVGGAGSCGDDGVILGQGVLVDGEHDGREIVACRSRDDDLLRACVNVSLRLFLGAVEAGALEHNINAELAPRQILCILFCIDLEGLAVHGDRAGLVVSRDSVLVLADHAAVALLCSIILQKMCKHRRLGQIVDRDDLIALSAEHLAECQTTDAAETIDSNFNRHWNYLLKFDTSILHHFERNCKHFDKKITFPESKICFLFGLHKGISGKLCIFPNS